MRKTRILFCSEATFLNTGYATYTREILKYLYSTGKYEIAELACYATKEQVEALTTKPPWKIYPNAPSPSSTPKEQEAYKLNPHHAFGSWRFDAICIHFKPDIVFDMRDHWMQSYQETSLARPFYKWVVMPTVDSAPQHNEWIDTFRNMDLVIPYTEWAKKTLTNQAGEAINLFPLVANAGVNPNVFTPPENKKELQNQVFEQDVLITGCVMRNQKRKLFPNIVKSYRAYLDRLLAEGKDELFNKSYLYLHTTYPEYSGWDFGEILLSHNMLDKTYFTSLCGNCKLVFPSKFHDQPLVCPTCQTKSCILPNSLSPVPTNALIKIYGLFDLFLQVAICEGFGMPQVEAAACGVPIASVDYSAMSEIVRRLDGYPIPVKTLFKEMETKAERAIPDNEALTQIIYDHFEMHPTEREAIGARTRELCKQYYNWDQVAEVWDKALSSVDISTNLPWSTPARQIKPNGKVPGGLTANQFIAYICDQIIEEPFLKNTTPVLTMHRDLCNGFTLQGKPFNHEAAMKNLEMYLQNKKLFEDHRTNTDRLFKEEFLNVN